MTERNLQTKPDNFNMDEFMAKYDRESDYRRFIGPWALIISVIAISFSVFQLYTAIYGVFDAHIQRAIHLCFGLSLVYMLYPTRKKWSRTKQHWFDVLLAVVAASTPLYIIINYQELVMRPGMYTNTDIMVGLVGVLLVMEAARRVVGWPIVIVASAFITYAFAGPYIPGALAHQGLNTKSLIGHLYYTTEGVFGIPLGVSSTFIFLFILFGAYLEKTGLGKFFIDMANAIAGWAQGGPAKVAVLSSACMGTVSGSSVGNVAGTGSLTIPMMKKLGYKPEFAGAVEATASTGGQLMPPIMGAAAFLMAEFVGIPYIDVVKAAVIPALLYFTGVWIGVHLEAKKLGLKGISRDQLPKVGKIFFERGHLAIPLVAIIYLLVSGASPMKAALWAIFMSIIASMLRQNTRISFKDIVKGLEDGARAALGVLVACATAGIIIGVVTKTGLGLRLGSTLIDLAQGLLLPTLFFTMITSIVLGMGVPTTANYVITSTIAAPIIMQLGVPVLAAHMFAFYFGIIADITPPVALAAFAGAGIARANPMSTGVNAVKLAIAAFLVPYIFVMSPQLLMIDTTFVEALPFVATALVGMVGVGAAVAGYLVTNGKLVDRLLLFVGGVMMIDPNLITDIAGVVLLAMGYIIQKVRQRKQKSEELAV